jgi:chitinase
MSFFVECSSQDLQIGQNLCLGTGGGGGGCAQTYAVVSGDTCSVIESRTGVSDAQLHALNPGVNSGCTSTFLFHLFVSIFAESFR